MKNKRLVWPIVLLVCALICTGTFWHWTTSLEHPGDADPSFYVEMADNIARQGSFEGDFIWHFFYKPDQVEHYAFDYWLPGTPLIQSVFISVTGDTLAGSALASFIFLLVLSIIFGKTLSITGLDAPLPWIAGLAFFCGFTPLFMNLLTTPYYLFFAFVTLLSLGLYISEKHTKYLYMCFLFAALTYWIRGDALLLLPFILMVVLFFKGVRDAFSSLLIGVGIYVAALLPLIILNVQQAGFTFPPSFKSLYLTDYMDLYAFWPVDSIQGWLRQLTFSTIVSDRISSLFRNVTEIFAHRPYIVMGLIPVIWLTGDHLKNRKLPEGLSLMGALPVIYSFLPFVFYSLLLPYYENGVLIAVTVASAGMFIILIRIALKWHGEFVAYLTLVFLAVFGLGVSFDEMNETGDSLHQTYSSLCNKVNEWQQKPVVMTRNVWDFSYECEAPIIQVPSDGMKAITAAIQKYNVNLLLIEDDWIENRAGIEKIVDSRRYKTDDTVFELVWSNGKKQKLYSVKPIDS